MQTALLCCAAHLGNGLRTFGSGGGDAPRRPAVWRMPCLVADGRGARVTGYGRPPPCPLTLLYRGPVSTHMFGNEVGKDRQTSLPHICRRG